MSIIGFYSGESMHYDIQKRLIVLAVIMGTIFVFIFAKVLYLTVFSSEIFKNREAMFIYRNISIEAPRGDIKDRYGRLLAGNRPGFNVYISNNTKIPVEKQSGYIQNVLSVLKKNNETFIDEFPIKKKNDQFYFTFDVELMDWKKDNNLPEDATAEECFKIISNLLNEEEIIKISPDDTENTIQKKMIESGYYIPISVSKKEFTQNIKKEDWLKRYFSYKELKDMNIAEVSAKDIFSDIRKKQGIPSNISDDQAREILVVWDLLKAQGSYKYAPVHLAYDVDYKTVAQIEEKKLDFPGVSIAVEPIRYYPNGNLASHIIGYLGKISGEDDFEKLSEDNEYDTSDIIGKTGLEKSYEKRLKGKKGYRKVQIDVKGSLVDNIEFVPPKSGDTVYSTIDLNLQKKAEETLAKSINCIKTGTPYKTDWGTIRMRDSKKIFNKAESGAVVVLDVKTGEVLAMASYPNYNPNDFVLGIPYEKYQQLMPKNMNDPMAPKPLFNIATMMSVQPGSTLKMITGIAGLENGLDPYYKIKDKGYIEIAKHKFGCWLWNQSRRMHGEENLMDAIRDSCNYYFYCVGMGYDYAKEQPMGISMNAAKIIETSKKFGLDDKTGIEIEEVPGKVPTTGLEKEKSLRTFENFLNDYMEDKFDDIDKNDPKYIKRIKEILSWTEHTPSRGELIKKLSDINVKPSQLNKVTDTLKFDYMNFMGRWEEGDAFNLAIGQGGHRYTPLQIARYISAVANNGYLNKVTVVDKRETFNKTEISHNIKTPVPIDLKHRDKLKYIIQGMIDVSDEGTSKAVFQNFDVSVASKTGTAQKSGKIPTADEKNYYLSHLDDYGVKYEDVINLANKFEKQSGQKLQDYKYIVKAILQLNPGLNKTKLDKYKNDYDEFAWFVSFAPAENPEIAIVSVLVQGGHGGYAAPMARDIYSEYFHINDNSVDMVKDSNLFFDDAIN